MTYGRIAGVERPVGRLILGCGGLRPERLAEQAAVLDAFVAAGGTALDTAHVYGQGASERALGQWLAARGWRERVVLITKGAHPGPDWRPRVTPDVIDRELRESLGRLGTDYVDLYLLHRDDPAAPVGPLVECLNAHLAAGRIRALGASNWSPERIEAFNAYAAAHGLRGFAASSPFLALAVARDPAHMGHAIVNGDARARAWYAATGLPLLAWSAQAQGFFSDRADDPALAPRFRRYDHPDNWERRRRVRQLARERGWTPTQVALAWVLHQPGDVFAIVGPGSVAHLRESLGALQVRLTAGELAWLNLEEAGGLPSPDGWWGGILFRGDGGDHRG
jgi:aryl-alcohol dehydrogenase-like predicted oxidoreductase